MRRIFGGTGKRRLVEQIARAQDAEILQLRLPIRDDLSGIHARLDFLQRSTRTNHRERRVDLEIIRI